MAPAQALAHREHPAVRAAITTYIFTVTVGVGGTPSSLGGPWLPQLPLMSVLSSPPVRESPGQWLWASLLTTPTEGVF